MGQNRNITVEQNSQWVSTRIIWPKWQGSPTRFECSERLMMSNANCTLYHSTVGLLVGLYGLSVTKFVHRLLSRRSNNQQIVRSPSVEIIASLTLSIHHPNNCLHPVSSWYNIPQNSFWSSTEDFFFQGTSVYSALGADFSALMRYINSRFTYLLTYFSYTLAFAALLPACNNPASAISRNFSVWYLWRTQTLTLWCNITKDQGCCTGQF